MIFCVFCVCIALSFLKTALLSHGNQAFCYKCHFSKPFILLLKLDLPYLLFTFGYILLTY